MLDAEIAAGHLRAPNVNRLYVVFTPPNVVVTNGGLDSQNDFAGYHSA
jgi:hypothetical protein